MLRMLRHWELLQGDGKEAIIVPLLVLMARQLGIIAHLSSTPQ